jgi:hypothetical protein
MDSACALVETLQRPAFRYYKLDRSTGLRLREDAQAIPLIHSPTIILLERHKGDEIFRIEERGENHAYMMK